MPVPNIFFNIINIMRNFDEPREAVPTTPVAGSGWLDWHQFLTRALGTLAVMPGATPAAAANAHMRPAEPSMRRPGAAFTNSGKPSRYQAELVRWISSAPRIPQSGVSWTPLHELDGVITPSGLHFERYHNGVPDIAPARHRLVIHGLFARPLSLDMAALRRYPRISRVLVVECGGNSNAGCPPAGPDPGRLMA
jgi:sulfane dehydrogenase subunit SoxC